jgi:hypothetical protein
MMRTCSALHNCILSWDGFNDWDNIDWESCNPVEEEPLDQEMYTQSVDLDTLPQSFGGTGSIHLTPPTLKGPTIKWHLFNDFQRLRTALVVNFTRLYNKGTF